MATRFWVGGAGTWDAVTTTQWAATTGGAGGQTVPGAADTVTFDGASGGGVVTVNFGGLITVQSITCGAFTGTLDFSANNNSVSLGSMSITGAGARTLNMGDGTWTITGSGTAWDMITTTNLTLNANSSTLNLVCNAATAFQFITSSTARTFNNVSVAANSLAGEYFFNTGNVTFNTLTFNGRTYNRLFAGSVFTCTTLVISGTAGSPVMIESSSLTAAASISVASNAPVMSFAGFRRMTFTGGASFVANNSNDHGGNTGITITAPSGGGPAAQRLLVQRGSPY